MTILSRAAALLLFFIWVGTVEMFLANFILAAEKIDINAASLEDLVKIIHIGETRARELISLRPFSSLDELIKIKGIGEARLKDIKEQSLAWIAPQSQPEIQLEPQPKPESEKPAINDSRQRTYSAGVAINEILPSAEGSDEKEEWIEVFNQNNFEVNLSSWQILDVIGATKTYTFPEETKISPQGFLIFSRPITKITLNNDGDGLNLIRPDGRIIDSVNYEKAPRGQSYNRTETGWAWSETLTPGLANIIPSPILETKKVESSKEEVGEQTPKKETERELAAIGEQIPKEPSRSSLVFLLAISLAVFFGVIILTLKKKVKDLDLLRKLE